MIQVSRKGAAREWLKPIAFVSSLCLPFIMLGSGCSDDGSGTNCTPNETRDCNCPPQRTGTQVCDAAGQGYSACDCDGTSGGGSSGAGGSGSGGSAVSMSGSGGNVNGGAGGTTPSAEFDGATGLPCTSDAECFGGLTCLLESAAETPFGSGGPQGGYCTQTCSDPSVCQGVDTFSECIFFGDNPVGFCLAACPVIRLDGAGQPFIPDTPVANEARRCLGRADLSCRDVLGDNSPIGICLPSCWSDADCAGDRVCDLGGGLCVDALPRDGVGAVGAACTVGADDDDCASGVCLPISVGDASDDRGFCSGFCTVTSSEAVGCGFGPDVASRGAGCAAVTSPVLEGDRGVCLELCDAVEDCAQPGPMDCDLFENADAEAFYGRAGRCIPSDDPGGVDAGAPDAG